MFSFTQYTLSPEVLAEAADKGHTIEAYGTKGQSRTRWQKTFKSYAELEKWINAVDAEVLGTRNIQAARKGVLSADNRPVDFKPDDLIEASKANVVFRDGDDESEVQAQRHKAVEANKKKAKGLQETEITEKETPMNEVNEMPEKLSFSEFVAMIDEQLNEYESKDGRYVHTKGTYGKSYQGDDEPEKKTKAAPAEKRGRGRPAGSKSGANQKTSSGKSYGGIASHSLSLPNRN